MTDTTIMMVFAYWLFGWFRDMYGKEEAYFESMRRAILSYFIAMKRRSHNLHVQNMSIGYHR